MMNLHVYLRFLCLMSALCVRTLYRRGLMRRHEEIKIGLMEGLVRLMWSLRGLEAQDYLILGLKIPIC